MIYIVIREVKHPTTGVRSFRALPGVLTDATEAALNAQQVASGLKCRAWACEFPTPPLLELAVADIKKHG